MKSSKVGQKHDRRLRILKDIAGLPILFTALAVDKDAIHKDSGLIYGDSMVKFVHRHLYQQLYSAISGVTVIADEHGDVDFMDGYRKYVEKHQPQDLFAHHSFDFAASTEEPLIQVADMIAGSLGRHFDAEKKSERSGEFLDALDPIRANIADWPPKYRVAERDTSDVSDDRALAQVALNQARRYLTESDSPHDDEVRERCCVVEYLLFQVQFKDPYGYIPTHRIRSELARRGMDVSEHRLRSSIIAPLRDAGLLIASSNKGYKIPLSVAELRDFVDHAWSIADPMLARVKHARDQVRLATPGATDILSGERYDTLRRVLELRTGRSDE